MILGHFKARLARLALAGLAVAAALVACGGGTSQFEAFVPDRMIVFGDETSLVRPDGLRYTVNPIGSSGAVDCVAEPIWTQALANQYGFVFQECNPNGATEVKGLMRASLGAKVDDLNLQIDNQIANGGFGAKDLVTVLVGANDVLEQYANYPQLSEDQLVAELRARGERLAAQVNRLVGLGPRVIISTVPDVGLTPFGQQQKSTATDTDRAALLTRLTSALNSRLRVNLVNDGRVIGLVLADELVQSMVRAPAAYGLTDAVTPVCTIALPDCTSQTMASSATSSSFLWSDDRHLAYGGHLRLGSLAVTRATGNPF